MCLFSTTVLISFPHFLLRFIDFQFMCMSLCLHFLCTTCVHCQQRPEEGDISLERESQGVVRQLVGAGKHKAPARTVSALSL